MEIDIKTKDEIEIMNAGGKIAFRVLENLSKAVKEGASIKDLDLLAEKLIFKEKAQPAFKGFRGYPTATCISVNDTVVHGIPTDKKIKEGDLVGIDIGISFQGYFTDTAKTVGVGKISPIAKKLLKVTQNSLNLAIRAVRPGRHLGDIQSLIQKTIEKEGFGVIRDLSGHGIGKNLQEEPSIPNFSHPGTGPVLKEGMTLAIEPMVSAGNWQVKILDDGWTVVTVDKSLSAHFEHTIAVTKNGAKILTKN